MTSNKYISRDHNNTRMPLTAACHASATGRSSDTASKDSYGASQAAKAAQ